MGDPIAARDGEVDAWLRVVYSNGTQSNLLLRSLQWALYKDEGGRRVSEPTAGPLFGDRGGAEDEPDRLPTGTLYVLRRRSVHPTIAAHRALIHEIGITGCKVETRIAGAADDAIGHDLRSKDGDAVTGRDLTIVGRRNVLRRLRHRHMNVQTPKLGDDRPSARHASVAVAFVMEALDGRLLDGAVHPLDLAVGPRMVRFGKPESKGI